MFSPVKNDPIEEQVYAKAVDWFTQLQSVSTSDESWDEFDQWLTGDPCHAEAYHKVKTMWEVMDDYAVVPEMVAFRHDALARARKSAKRRWSVSLWNTTRIPLAVAASVILVSAAVLFYFFPQSENQRYQTGLGEQQLITLADNTRVALDVQTVLDVKYNDAAREIELVKGQAHFHVTRDPLRPFKVNASGQTVVALGTAFNVEILDEELRVTLIEGKVAVTEAKIPDSGTDSISEIEVYADVKARQLSPGQQLIVPSQKEFEIIKQVDVNKAIAWLDGKFIFEDEPLKDVVARMNRYSHIKLEIRDKDINELKISGVFNAGDINSFVEALEAYFPIKAITIEKSTVGLIARK